MIAKYGAYALRLYVMFVAPPEKEVEWSDSGLEGSSGFAGRVWRIADHLIPAVARWAAAAGGSRLTRPNARFGEKHTARSIE